MKKNKGKVNKRKLPSYFILPVYFTLILIPVAMWLSVENSEYGLIAGGAVVLYLLISFAFYGYSKNRYEQDMVEFAVDYTQVQRYILKNLDIPYVLVDHKGKIMWRNNAFSEITEGISGRYINDLMPELDIKERPELIKNDGKFYRIEYKELMLEDYDEEDIGTDDLIAVYLFDETEVRTLKKENHDQKMACGLLYIDNYEDVLEKVDEVRGSVLVGLVERKINQYFAAYNAVVRKLEKDKFFIVIKQKYISVLQSNKFSILDEIKTVNAGNEMAVTLSMGFGINGSEYTGCFDSARVAIDLALGRGGDQAVLKDGEKIYFYGGKSKQVEKNTRVKARIKAHALRELIETKGNVIIMGHRMGDIDSLGSAVGIYRAATSIGKEVHIVINEVTSSIRTMLEEFKKDEEYPTDMFIDSEKAIEIATDTTVVVVVDISRAGMVECPEILVKSKNIVVLDHHRRSSDTIDNAALSYIEPFASSASEMVAEILQYFSDGLKIRKLEADAMYGGIMIDTNNFTGKTGVRTFEACAFLKKCGADVTRVHNMFRESLEDYQLKAKAISTAEAYRGKYAITNCPSENVDSPTVLGAKIANELLDIKGVKASFALTDYNGKIYISARSLGNINVQLIMEKLGGGGHLDVAGAQLERVSLYEARERVKKAIDEQIEEDSTED